jgi:CHAT domain-containing protein/tetratricopeptide (TPR) repeat protein
MGLFDRLFGKKAKPDLADFRRWLERNPVALSDTFDKFLGETIAKTQKEGNLEVLIRLEKMRDLLRHIREAGIDATFREVQAKGGIQLSASQAYYSLAEFVSVLGTLYYESGDGTAAEWLFKEAKRRLPVETASEKVVIRELYEQINTLSHAGRHQEAIPMAEQLRTLVRQFRGGEDNPDFARSLTVLGKLYYESGGYTAAESPLKQACDIFQAVRGADSLEYAASLDNLAMLYFKKGDYGAAKPLFQQSLELRRKVLGKDHPDYGAQLNDVAIAYHLMGDLPEAVLYFRQAVEIRSKALGTSHPDTLRSLDHLARLYAEMGNYEAVKALPENPGRDIVLLKKRAIQLLKEHQLKQAIEVETRICALTRQLRGESDSETAVSLDHMAGLYEMLDDYAKAESLFEEALEIQRVAVGEQHPRFAAILLGLGDLRYRQGNYAAAAPAYRRALEIQRATIGKDHLDYADGLKRLSRLYQDWGDVAEAEKLLQQAIEIERRSPGVEKATSGASLTCLGTLYYMMGNYAAAGQSMLESLELVRTAFGKESPAVASILHNLAMVYLESRRYKEAELLLRQTIEIQRKAVGESSPVSFATSLNSLALLYKEMGNYTAAEPLYQQSLEIVRTVMGDRHPHFSASLENLARLYAATDRENESLALLEQAAAIDDGLIGQVFSVGSESQRMAFLETFQGSIETFLSLVVQHLAHSSSAVRAAMDLVLRRKAVGAEALAAQRDAVLGGKYPALEAKLRELTTLRMQIAQKTLAGPGPEGLEAHRKQLAEWDVQKERFEADLARQVPEINLEQKLRAAQRNAVALALPEGSTLVEFVRFRVFDFKAIPARGESHWRPPRYVAFVLPAGEPDNVHMIDLGEAEPIDQMIATFRAGITGEAETRGAQDGSAASKRPTSPSLLPGADLRAAVFDPIRRALDGRKRLLLAPDGDLSRLPFEVLPTDGGRRLVDDYHISYVATGRDVLRFGAASGRQPGAPLVAADPDFDLSAQLATTGVAPKGIAGGRASRSIAWFFSSLLGRRGVAPAAAFSERDRVPTVAERHSRDLDRNKLHFGPLPGSRVEGQRLAQMLRVQPWLGEAALESQLKSCRSPRILHIATHGFFLPDQKRDPNQEQRGLGLSGVGAGGALGRMAGPGLENPLLRSGLALAGANTWCRGGSPPAEAEDGILTAEDVSGLDLLDTELVVLSACETGLGEVRTGEGVFGLRRAFVLAGAKALVMSLWKVPDQQTQELMQEFYRRILEGQPRADALREAQLAMKAKYPPPLYWGAFICQGDPRSLP